MTSASEIGRAVLIAGGYGLAFALVSRELLKLLDPQVVVVSGLRVERPWFRRFVLVFFALGALATVVAPLTLLLDPHELGPARWFLLGTLIFDAIWLAGLVMEFRAKYMP